MSWDPVPWFIGGGAHHSGHIARTLAYMMLQGREGVAAPGHLQVLELATPGAGVRVSPGVGGILARWAPFQAYISRNTADDIVDVDPTTPSAGRSDLVVVRVEDPEDPISGPWTPADVEDGPYIHSRIIPNVPASTKKLQEVFPDQSGIAVARIDIPVNTGTITQAMIKPLTSLIFGGETIDDPAVPDPLLAESQYTDVKEVTTFSLFNFGDTSYTSWPTGASWSVPVPSWTTHMDVECWIANTYRYFGNVRGKFRLRVSGSQQFERSFDVNSDTGANGTREHFPVSAGNITVPSTWRGKVVTFDIQAKMDSGQSGTIESNPGNTSLSLKVFFKRNP